MWSCIIRYHFIWNGVEQLAHTCFLYCRVVDFLLSKSWQAWFIGVNSKSIWKKNLEQWNNYWFESKPSGFSECELIRNIVFFTPIYSLACIFSFHPQFLLPLLLTHSIPSSLDLMWSVLFCLHHHHFLSGELLSLTTRAKQARGSGITRKMNNPLWWGVAILLVLPCCIVPTELWKYQLMCAHLPLGPFWQGHSGGSIAFVFANCLIRILYIPIENAFDIYIL